MICVCGCTCHTHMRRSEDSIKELVFSFNLCVGSVDQPQVTQPAELSPRPWCQPFAVWWHLSPAAYAYHNDGAVDI